MEEQPKETKIKRTHTFDRKLLARLETAAKKERRAVSEQLSIFLEKALAEFEKEKPSGPKGLVGAIR
jgi:hypothetical protein